MLLFFKRLAKSNGYIYFFLLNIYNNYNRFISKLKTEIILHSNTCKIQYDIIGKKKQNNYRQGYYHKQTDHSYKRE